MSESIKNETVPEATFIEIAELFGANNWKPQPLSFLDEINRLKNIYKDNLTEKLIKDSLQRSGKWHLHQDITNSWFESGDVAKESLVEATKKHEENQSQPIETIVTECLLNRCIDKWRIIFLITCLWMRSKEEHNLCYDLFIVLHCLANEEPPSSIPLICNMATQSTATVIRRESQVQDDDVFCIALPYPQVRMTKFFKQIPQLILADKYQDLLVDAHH